ncbi:Hsp20/alpha crystallin family protein [Deltaproteobacteria bacterium OttesenSCG-928-K17]|nr:Hsp20/alpha crystallin family protein [Deltaproteobacteria bacterium OttesenSCG-928-K17]
MSPDLNVREKQEVNMGAAENTSDKPMFSPVVDIWETDAGLMLVADMPGVTPDSLSIDLQDNTLTISGKVPEPAEGRKMLIREYEVGGFYRQFALADNIDQAAITAALKDGVLKLELPRVAPAQPRKINVKTDDGPTA